MVLLLEIPPVQWISATAPARPLEDTYHSRWVASGYGALVRTGTSVTRAYSLVETAPRNMQHRQWLISVTRG